MSANNFSFIWHKCGSHSVMFIVLSNATFCGNMIEGERLNFKFIKCALMVRYAAIILNLNFFASPM